MAAAAVLAVQVHQVMVVQHPTAVTALHGLTV
jgi:hypothetical protein